MAKLPPIGTGSPRVALVTAVAAVGIGVASRFVVGSFNPTLLAVVWFVAGLIATLWTPMRPLYVGGIVGGAALVAFAGIYLFIRPDLAQISATTPDPSDATLKIAIRIAMFGLATVAVALLGVGFGGKVRARVTRK